jgi:hypothetical protein
MENSIPKRGYFTDVSKCIKNIKVNFSVLRQGKLMSTLRTLDKSALHRGWTAGTSKGSAIRYVKGKTTLWATQYMLRLRTHLTSLSLNQPPNEILKTFLKALKIVTVKSLSTSKTIKYYI